MCHINFETNEMHEVTFKSMYTTRIAVNHLLATNEMLQRTFECKSECEGKFEFCFWLQALESQKEKSPTRVCATPGPCLVIPPIFWLQNERIGPLRHNTFDWRAVGSRVQGAEVPSIILKRIVLRHKN